MDREEFKKLFKENAFNLTGKFPDEEDMDQQYEYFLEISDIAQNKQGIPIFRKDEKGDLRWSFKPIR